MENSTTVFNFQPNCAVTRTRHARTRSADAKNQNLALPSCGESWESMSLSCWRMAGCSLRNLEAVWHSWQQLRIPALQWRHSAPHSLEEAGGNAGKMAYFAYCMRCSQAAPHGPCHLCCNYSLPELREIAVSSFWILQPSKGSFCLLLSQAEFGGDPAFSSFACSVSLRPFRRHAVQPWEYGFFGQRKRKSYRWIIPPVAWQARQGKWPGAEPLGTTGTWQWAER